MNLYLLADSVRSAYNVGSLFRLCDAVFVDKLFLTGISPYPKLPVDSRPNFIANKADKEIRKTALVTVDAVSWEHYDDPRSLCQNLKSRGVKIVVLEQTPESQNYLEVLRNLADKKTDICLVVGHEREGVSKDLIALADFVIEIPMKGRGKSLNVAMAATVVLYYLQQQSGGVA